MGCASGICQEVKGRNNDAVSIVFRPFRLSGLSDQSLIYPGRRSAATPLMLFLLFSREPQENAAVNSSVRLDDLRLRVPQGQPHPSELVVNS